MEELSVDLEVVKTAGKVSIGVLGIADGRKSKREVMPSDIFMKATGPPIVSF